MRRNQVTLRLNKVLNQLQLQKADHYNFLDAVNFAYEQVRKKEKMNSAGGTWGEQQSSTQLFHSSNCFNVDSLTLLTQLFTIKASNISLTRASRSFFYSD